MTDRRDRNKAVAEFALKDMTKPIGVTDYRFPQELPEELQKAFPDTEKWAEHISFDDSDSIG